MKAIKKRCKELLSKIKQTSEELNMVCADLSVLSEVGQLNNTILSQTNLLIALIANVKKAELRLTLAESEAWANLEEYLDLDMMSALEERFFTLLDNNAEHQAGDFFQEFLAKIDIRFSLILSYIQEISDLIADEEE